MQYIIKAKVGLITGGASGIGLCCAKELLRNGLKAVTLADLNVEKGVAAVQEIESEFGENRALFVKTDTSDKQQYEGAFQQTVRVFKNIDIVVNNAGILTEALWERECLVNINGVVNGTILALEYMPKYRQGNESFIVNISSISGLDPVPSIPIYSATKHAVLGLSRGFGCESHYNRTKVRVLTLCPGLTDTPLIVKSNIRNLNPEYEKIAVNEFDAWSKQTPEVVAKALIHIINMGKTASAWVVEENEPVYEVEFLPRQMRRKVQT